MTRITLKFGDIVEEVEMTGAQAVDLLNGHAVGYAMEHGDPFVTENREPGTIYRTTAAEAASDDGNAF